MSINNFSKSNKKLSIYILLALAILIGTYAVNSGLHKLSINELLQASKVKTICKDCNVIVVTLDTLSANHLPCYGYYRNTSPKLCSFAEENIFFQDAYSNGTWTLPSHASIFSGLYPMNVGVNDYFDRMDPKITLLPQLLKSNGYNTMLFFPDRNNPSFPIDGVYDRLGDSVYQNIDYPWDKSIEMFKESVKNKNKTFMFLHTYDVHEPFIIGESQQKYRPFNNKLPTTHESFEKIEWTNEFIEKIVEQVRLGIDSDPAFQQDRKAAEILFPKLLKVYPDRKKTVEVLNEIANTGMLWNYMFDQKYTRLIDTKNPDDINSLISLYDQTINNLDENKVSMIIDLVNDPEFKENTVLVILGDHGEEFMEHGYLYHVTPYNSNVRVPLIMHVPGIKNKKVNESVQLVDVFPTLTEILGINTNIKFDGKSLIRRILGIDKSKDLIITNGEFLETMALKYGQWKLYLKKQDDGSYLPYELYNVLENSREKDNLIFSRSDIKNEILSKTKKFLEH